MLDISTGTVTEIIQSDKGMQEISVMVDGKSVKALNYIGLLGTVIVGDIVKLNTTAVRLGLGTGGYHFVLDNMSLNACDSLGPGHIMKLRYTPMQTRVLAVEEEGSPYHELMREADSLEDSVVVVLSLHSQLAPVIAAIKANDPLARISYIMTDSAALPLAVSHTVNKLVGLGVLDATITAGQSFGGDLEAVNVFSAMLAAHYILKSKIIIIGMGPGVVGTGTRWGFSGVEQGELINAVSALEGKAVAVPRISFADSRERHKGLSHHTLTALGRVAQVPAWVALPFVDKQKEKVLRAQIDQVGLDKKHRLLTVREKHSLELLAEWGINPNTMGRSISQDLEFFQAAAAAGRLALELSISSGVLQ